MTSKELYPSLVQQIIHAENITWNRFNNFLLFNSILILGWVQVWCNLLPPSQKTVILLSICSLGAVSGIFWAAIGNRGREFLKAYMDMAAEMEAETGSWTKELENYKPLTKTINLRDSLCYSWAGSRVILIAGPLAFTVLYGIMFFVSLAPLNLSSPKEAMDPIIHLINAAFALAIIIVGSSLIKTGVSNKATRWPLLPAILGVIVILGAAVFIYLTRNW